NETPYIAMELVEGETLKERLYRGAVPPDQLLPIARQVAEALHEAHQKGVLHGDIKPGNTMIDAKGRVKLLDFGLAVVSRAERKAGESSDDFVSRTAVKGVSGTIPYMAPEQLRGETVDQRADVFSFGVLLFECLTTRRPFGGQTPVDTMHAILHDAPPSIRTSLPEIDPRWEELINHCLVKSPDQRLQSMENVLELVRQIESTKVQAQNSVAVLYFENLSRDKDDEYFRDGMTEDIITELSKIRDLVVFPRSSVLGYRDKPVTAPQIGQQLAASHVLEGSLRRAGNRLRITARLVQARTGHSVWAERYDRQLEDVFEIQDEIARSIARALRVMLSESEKRAIAKAPTANVQAYDLYLRGRQYFYQLRHNGMLFAKQLFERAIEIDATFAKAYAGVADCCCFLYQYWDASEQYLQQADSASRKALELDEDLAEAHVSRGYALALRRRYVEAQQEFERAIDLDPRLYEAYYFYARAKLAEGNHEEAVRLFREAWNARPEDFQAPIFLGNVLHGLGRPQEALDAHRAGIQIAERNLELNPDNARALSLGAGALIQLGEKEKGRIWLARALAIDPDDPLLAYNAACAHAGLGDTDDAIALLERAIENGFGQREWVENDNDLDSIRSHPRYAAILTAIDEKTRTR
ncbi:MAG TPA: protein kinase, partial [Thermoanaerobaculia bacterium]